MMEIARGCPETGWVLALTAGHPLILANFPLARSGASSTDQPANSAVRRRSTRRAAPLPVAGRLSRHRLMAVRVGLRSRHASHGQRARHRSRTASRPRRSSRCVLERAQYRIVDDWHVMGMQGTGSKRIVAEDAFVPAQRTILGGRAGTRIGAGGAPRTAREPDVSRPHRVVSHRRSPPRLRSAPRAARSTSTRRCCALKRTYHPPYHERFRESRGPGAFRPRARPRRDRRGGADPRRRGVHGVRARRGRRRSVRRREGPAADPDRAPLHAPGLGGGGADLPHGRHLGCRAERRHDRAHLPQPGGDQHPPGAAARAHRRSMPRAPASGSRQLRR